MVIGIGGCSNAGKSNLAKQIKAKLEDKKTFVLCQEDYTIDDDLIPKYFDHTDWELPESIDIKKYINDVEAAKDEYDLVICEGLFVFWFEELSKYFDRQIYLQLNRDEFLLRKAQDSRWGEEPEWYIRHIWDNHLIYGLRKHEKESDIIIDANLGLIDTQQIIQQIYQDF